MSTRTRYEIQGQYVTVTEPDGARCDWWCPTQGGYVRRDPTCGRFPGTLGQQPTTDGVTWRAVDVADMLEQIKAARRRAARRDRYQPTRTAHGC